RGSGRKRTGDAAAATSSLPGGCPGAPWGRDTCQVAAYRPEDDGVNAIWTPLSRCQGERFGLVFAGPLGRSVVSRGGTFAREDPGQRVPTSSDSIGRTYIDGEMRPGETATVWVFDHGLLYGDGIFEGIRVYSRRIFRLDAHLDRLYASGRAIALDV